MNTYQRESAGRNTTRQTGAGRISIRRFGSALRVIALACLLVTLTSVSLSPVQSEGPAPQEQAMPVDQPAAQPQAPQAPQAPSGLNLLSVAQSSAGAGTQVFNGEPITYTFRIYNTGSTAATNIKVFDSLPPDTLDQIACTPECHRVVVTSTVVNPLGGFILVTKTVMITWTVSSLAASPAPAVLAFRGRVVGKADGTIFTNSAFVSFDQGSPIQGQALQTTVRQRILDTGSASLPGVPTWFSADSGGTLGQAWGDYDRDGMPDLALAASVGTSIYHNDSGRLRKVMNNSKQSYGAVWADVDHDGSLELVVVGDSVDGTLQTPGLNYIYHYSPTIGTFTLYSTFQSPFQLARIAAADLDGDGFVDLVGSTNAINANPAVMAFRNDGTGTFSSATPIAISSQASAAIGVGDINNDGLPDLSLGQFPSGMKVLINTSAPGAISFASIPIAVDSSISFLPYAFSFGDFDGDGFLDLAAAFPLQREARIYHNAGGAGFALSATLRTNVFWTPLSVDWTDFTGDGTVDLVVADSPPKIYHYDGASNTFKFLAGLTSGAIDGQVWDIHGVQNRPYQGVSLALTDRDHPSMIFDSVLPSLKRSLYHVDPVGDPMPASSVALGDLSNSGRLDIVYGASDGSLGSRQYHNQNGTFSGYATLATPLGPQSIAFGDLTGHGQMVLAVGSSVDVRLYSLGGTQLQQFTPGSGGPYVVAWGDINGDGLLDLLVGTNGPVYAYLNKVGTLSTTPIWTSTETCQTTSLAWADYDRDNWLDFAVGCKNAPTRLYHNASTNAFTLAWASPLVSNTTSLAWSDYNNDGWPDLAVGALNAPVVLYENAGGVIGKAGLTPVWQSSTISATTGIAWGDWNNDGYPELAVANRNQPAQVFGNFGSLPGQPRLFWVWTSEESSAVTGVAWGDVNGDGNQDLVVSSAANGMNGVYLNGASIPAQYSSVFTPTLPLPHVAPYVTLRRPGNTTDAFLYSSSELLGGWRTPTVTVQYKVFAPDNSRKDAITPVSTTISGMRFEYSLTGGATWLTATPAISSPLPITSSTRLGQAGIFYWNAIADKAISDNALFRVTAIKADATGPVQRTAGSTVSVPFRVRATTCDWPASPFFTMDTPQPKAGQVVNFYGAIGSGSGQITVTWDFGDGSSPALGQNVVHSYTSKLMLKYTVKMSVVGTPCPITRPVYTSTIITAGDTPATHFAFMPVVRKSSATLENVVAQNEPVVAEPVNVTGQITTVVGSLEPSGAVHLAWAAPAEGVTGYRVYTQAIGSAGPFTLVASLPGSALDFKDTAGTCGAAYFVTSMIGSVEVPSSAVFYSAPCQRAGQ